LGAAPVGPLHCTGTLASTVHAHRPMHPHGSTLQPHARTHVSVTLPGLDATRVLRIA
jgi:hypothetical protein